MADFSNSPLNDPDFLKSDPIADALRDDQFVDSAAVGLRKGNDIAADGTLVNDLSTMTYGQVFEKYGKDVADQQTKIVDQARTQERQLDESRTAGEILADSVSGAGAAAVNLGGSVVAATLGAAGAVDEYFDEENTGFSEMSVKATELTGQASDFIRGFQSDNIERRKELSGIEGQLDAADEQARYEAEGDSSLVAKMRREGRNALNTGERILSDGAVAGDLITEAIGSLGPSSVIAKAGVNLAQNLTSRVASSATAQKLAQTIGASAGIGVAESTGAYTDAVNKVMSFDHESLLAGSDLYVDMINEGLSPLEAKTMIAADAGRQAFTQAFPSAAALGLLTAKFEANPIKAFDGVPFVEGLRQVGLQTFEEAGQGSISALAVNDAIQDNADRTQDDLEGIGEAAVTGAIAGAGMAGAVGGVSAGINNAVTEVDTTDAAPVASASDILASAGSLAADGIDAATRAAQPLVEPTKVAAQKAVDTAKAVAAPVVEAAEDFNNRPDTAAQTENLNALDEVRATEEVTPEQDEALSGVSEVLNKLAEPKAKVRKLLEADVIDSAAKIQALASKVDTLPPEVQKTVRKIMQSQDVAAINKRVKEIDLNKTQGPDIEVNPTTTAETVAVAKINPANVNPTVVGKILKQTNKTDITPEDVKILEVASKVATAVNAHVDGQVQISNDYTVALSQKPAYKANPDRLPQPASAENTSRSVAIDGLGDLRSVNDFAADIIQGVQSETGSIVDAKGVKVKTSTIANQFSMFAEHMVNKVEALNKSYDSGTGENVMFRSLNKGVRMVNPGEPGNAKAVFYRPESEKSVRTAESAYNDAVLTAEVYNTLVEAFPDQFPGGKIEVPALRRAGDVTNTQQEEVQTNEPETQEEARSEEVSADEVSVEESTSPDQEVGENEPREAEDNSDTDTTDVVEPKEVSETPVEIKDEYLVDDNNEPLTFYHGTNDLEFTEFSDNENGNFITTSLGEAQRYRTEGEGRVIKVQVKANADNIAVFEAEDGASAQDYWLANTSEIKAQAAGKDGAMIIGSAYTDLKGNEQQDAIFVAFRGDRLQIVNDEASAPTTLPYEALSEQFRDTYLQADAEVSYHDAESLLSLVQNEKFSAFANDTVIKLMEGAQTSLQTSKYSKDKTVGEMLQEGKIEDLLKIRDYKAAMIVDPATGQYNEQLLSLASLAVVDWMSSARSSDPSRLSETMEDLGITFSDMEEGDMENIMFGVPPHQAAEAIAKMVLKTWNVKDNPDAQLVDSRGAVEGLVKELLVVASNEGLITIEDIPVMTDGVLQRAQTLNVKPLQAIQQDMGMEGQAALQKFLTPEDLQGPSFGEKIKGTEQTQSRGNIPLSNKEKAALKRMQDTPHMVSEGVANLVETMGFEPLFRMLGGKDLETIDGNKTLISSVKGKNLSIERDFADAMMVLEGAREVDAVYYPVSISKVGRHQFKGINPQNNKILRAMVTPTHSTLDMNQKEDRDAFWLTVAQASDLRKVENEDHALILSEIQQQFSDKYGAAVSLVQDWLTTGELDGEALANAMPGKGMAELSAVVAVAQLRFAEANGTQSEFQTTLSFELDGKTDGPANMMNNFGQGKLTKDDMQNFNRVGFFLGRTDATLNKYFSAKNVDLYEVTSRLAEKLMFGRTSGQNLDDKRKLNAANRFAVAFGDFKLVNKDGSVEMTRNTSKNPMTKTVYGSTVFGVGQGVAQDMMVNFYQALVDAPEGADFGPHLGYPNLADDIEILFGEALPEGLSKDFEFSKKAQKHFQDIAVQGLGAVLSEAAKTVIGPKITKVNEALVMATNVQTAFIEKLFDRKLAEMVELRASEGKIARNKKGEGIVRQLSKRDYDAVVKEMQVYAPLYANDTQTLGINAFAAEKTNIELSSTMSGKLRQGSTLARPQPAGVKVIPYLSIGRGDASMMNTIYSDENAPTDTLPVFDGIDMPVSKVKTYADQINGAVMKNWDTDILVDVVDDFSSFLRHAGKDADLLVQAFADVASKQDKSTTFRANDSDALLSSLVDFRRQNQARKAVFKQIPVSVDHMGGSDSAFTRGEGAVGLEGINNLIDVELGKAVQPALPQEEMYAELNVSDADTMIRALQETSKDNLLRKTLREIQDKVPAGMTVVTGSLDQLNTYRADNFEADGLTLEGAGNYDVEHNVLYLAKKSHETLVHELVHAATFGAVLDHYDGTKVDPAVQRIEDLMNEFMGLDFGDNTAVATARAEILGYQSNTDPMNQAAALNEFMAWALTDQNLTSTLSKTRTSTLANLAKKVVALMKRMFGSVPTDIYSSLLFNTSLLNQTEATPVAEEIVPDDHNNDDGEMTPPAHEMTNFWIDLLKEKMTELRLSETAGEKELDRLGADVDNAQEIITTLDFGGFSLSDYQKQTFKAIHIVLATEMRLDAQSADALNKVFTHVTDNLTPDMMGSQERYATVMNLFGNTQNAEGVSDAIAVLLALSQTSKGFRAALDQIPTPESNTINAGTLNDFLTTSTGFLMRKIIGTIDTNTPELSALMDTLAENLIRNDTDREYSLLRGVMASIDKADEFTSGYMSEIAGRTEAINQEVRASDRSKLVKLLSGSAATATAFLDQTRADIAAEGIKTVTHMGNKVPVTMREFVSEVIGTDRTNSEVVALLDRANYNIDSVRQAYREDLPGILQSEFETAPDESQWKAMHTVMGKTDFTSVFDLSRPNESMRVITSSGLRNKKLENAEKAIRANFNADAANTILEKSEQLARYMVTGDAGHLLLKNAYAINKVAGDFKENMTAEIDALITYHAINLTPQADRDAIAEMYENDPQGVLNMAVYTQGLNKEEDQKVISETARMNGYKGFIPDAGREGVRIIVELDEKKSELERMGFTRVSDFTGADEFSAKTRGYYVTTVKSGGAYSQGAMKSVQDSYRGVDATTGLTTNGSVSGAISGDALDSINEAMNDIDPDTYSGAVMSPVWNEQGEIDAYEFVIDPIVVQTFIEPKGNMATQLGVWAGRQVEEKFAHQFNGELVGQLKKIWDESSELEKDLFVDLSKETDPIYADSWRVISPQTRAQIETAFGGNGFMVRKDMINLAVGYREASIVDMWTGKTRMPKAVQEVVQAVAGKLIGKTGLEAVTVLSKGESALEGVVSSAKDLIVVRSLIVPFMNIQANMLQLTTRGVPTKQIVKGTRDKLAEIEQFNENVKDIIRLDAKIQLSAEDANAVAILNQQKQKILDQNARMSIAPLIEAGAYKNISEGITDLDVEVTSGRLAEWTEAQMSKLPGGVQTVAKYGIMSKDTALYKGANKAVQYGDFLAKAITFDHLMSQGMDQEQALSRINEEFVNFSPLPGRVRSKMESIGASWFMAFKIRIMKIAMNMIRENPVRSLVTATTLSDLGSPIGDNLATVAAQDRLDYSLGWDMLFGAPDLNPWMQLTEWK